MSAEVDYVLESIAEHWPGGGFADVPLTRVDRDDAEFFESGLRSRTSELRRSNYVGASFEGESPQPAGYDYEHRLRTIVSVRLIGMHHSERGHIDPSGENGIPWSALKRKVRYAILWNRSYPEVDRVNTEYQTILTENDTDLSSNYANFYSYEFDVALPGYEQLPGGNSG